MDNMCLDGTSVLGEDENNNVQCDPLASSSYMNRMANPLV
jgi:hypothetical protein